jgi:hypothetical protein
MFSTKTTFLRADEKRSIQALLKFFRLQCVLETFGGRGGGFSQFLGLAVLPTKGADGNDAASTHNNVREEDLFFEKTDIPPYKAALVYRYHLQDSLQQLNVDQTGIRDTKVRLSTYTSILDDVSTWSMILGSCAYPRPGVSVSMHTEWGPGARSSPSLSDPWDARAVDIVTTLTKKGQTMGFLRSEVKHPITSEVICYYQHTKFLNPGWLLRILLSPQGMWCLEKMSKYIFPFLVRSKPMQNESIRSKQILESFEMSGETTATFRVGPQHTNGFGGLHGGVQAILMEKLGRIVAKKRLTLAMQEVNKEVNECPHQLNCERLLVSYQSSASKKLKIQAFVMDLQASERTVSLRMVIERDDNAPSNQSVLVSEGILNFAMKPSCAA